MGEFNIVTGDTFSISSEEESDKIIMDSWPDGMIVCNVTKKRVQGVGFYKGEDVNCHGMEFTIVKIIQSRKKRKKNVRRGKTQLESGKGVVLATPAMS